MLFERIQALGFHGGRWCHAGADPIVTAGSPAQPSGGQPRSRLHHSERAKVREMDRGPEEHLEREARSWSWETVPTTGGTLLQGARTVPRGGLRGEPNHTLIHRQEGGRRTSRPRALFWMPCLQGTSY